MPALALALLAWSVQAQAAELVFRSAPGGTSLLELFSSEGCSSCPPADAFLSTLKTHPRLWRDFVPVAFHVDYWDYLGWKDALARPEYTQRQSDYGRLVTPEFVLNGRAWWDAGGDVPKPAKDAGKLIVRSPDLLHADINYAGKGGPYVAHAALLGFGISHDVRRGENAGATLKHDFAALALAQTPLDDHGEAKLELHPSVAAQPDRYALAVWISRADDPAPLQAAGGWLAKGKPK